MVSMVIVFVVVVIYVFFQDCILVVILVVVMLILIIFMIFFGFVVQRKVDCQWKFYQRFFNYFVDFFCGLEILCFLGLSKLYSKNIFYVSEWYCKVIMSMFWVVFLFLFVFDFFMMLLVVIVVVFLGLCFIDGDILFGLVLMVFIFVFEYFLLVWEVGNDYYVMLNGQEVGKII